VCSRPFSRNTQRNEGHVDRLEQVFATIDKKPQAKTCDAIVGKEEATNDALTKIAESVVNQEAQQAAE
jgi:ferritin-like metal-binding protein YciE